MACELTSGFLLECKDSWGGIKNVLLCQLEDLVGIAYDVTTGEVDTLGTITLYRYAVDPKIPGSMSAPMNANDSGSPTFTTAVTLTLRKLSTAKRKELLLLAKNRLAVFVEDMNDNIWLCGRDRGMELSAADFTTGTALGDANGIPLTFSGEDVDVPIRLESYTTTPFDNAGFASITVSPAY